MAPEGAAGSDSTVGGSGPVGAGGSSGEGVGGSVPAGSGGSGSTLPSDGCTKPWSPADAEIEERSQSPAIQLARRSITVAGAVREYLVAVPVDYDPARAYPLVFGFHGGSGDREQLRRYMNLEEPAAGAALFLYPSGPVLEDRGTTGWNLDADSDDLLFVDALLEKYTAELCVDRARIFATGHSFGGCMSNTVGCFRGDVFRAIAPVAGCGPFSRAECVGQVATLQIHSPHDTQTSYSGAIAACTRYLRANACQEDPACGCHWVDGLEDPEDQCIQNAQVPYETNVSIETSERDAQEPVLRAYQACAQGFPVVFADHFRRERDLDEAAEERWHNPPPWSESLIWEFFTNLPQVAP